MPANEEQKSSGTSAKPCDHTDIERMYVLGSKAGSFVCPVCGKEFSEKEMKEREKENDLL